MHIVDALVWRADAIHLFIKYPTMNPTIAPARSTLMLHENGDAALQTIVAIGPTFLWVMLILICLVLFKGSIRSFLSRTTQIEAFGAKFFSQTAGQVAGVAVLEGAVNQFKQNDLATPYTYALSPIPLNIYFFSHDLMLTYAGLLTGARADIILFTLQSALNHILPLGLKGSPVDVSLTKVAEKLRHTVGPLNESDRSDLALKIWTIARFVGDRLFAAAKF